MSQKYSIAHIFLLIGSVGTVTMCSANDFEEAAKWHLAGKARYEMLKRSASAWEMHNDESNQAEHLSYAAFDTCRDIVAAQHKTRIHRYALSVTTPLSISIAYFLVNRSTITVPNIGVLCVLPLITAGAIAEFIAEMKIKHETCEKIKKTVCYTSADQNKALLNLVIVIKKGF